jgi:hypothetical protein
LGVNLIAAQSGDRRAALLALRDTLAGLLDTTDKQIHAQLAAQYRATLADLAALKPEDGKTARERLAERVAAADVVA